MSDEKKPPEGGEFFTDSDGQKYVRLPNGEEYPCCAYVGQTKHGYICSNDFCHEVGDAPATGPICNSLESLKEIHPCVEHCGWVRVLLVAVEFGGPDPHECECDCDDEDEDQEPEKVVRPN